MVHAEFNKNTEYLMAKWKNSESFQYGCINGTSIRSKRYDFVGGIDIFRSDTISDELFAQDMFEFGRWMQEITRKKLKDSFQKAEFRIIIE